MSHKNENVDELSYQPLPTFEQWRKFESNRLLLQSQNKILFPILFRFVAFALVAFDAPPLVVGAWAILLFGIEPCLQHLTRAYESLLNEKPDQKIMTLPMSEVAQKFKFALVINAIIWGGLSLISQLWSPFTLRILCVAFLLAVMFMLITRSYVDRKMMLLLSAILIFAQVISSFIRILVSGNDPEVLKQAFTYSGCLLLIIYLLWTVGYRFIRIHETSLESEYSKLVLIDNLSKNKAQLHLEQQALVASNKLVQQFYSGAAHDLRQPVYAMQLYTSMLADDTSLSKVLLPKITQSCISINDMFNTLFDYQQTHMNDDELVEIDNNIQEMFKSLALNFQPIAVGKGLQIRFRPIAGSITMVPLYLTRILSNLIANALRYTNTGGVLVAARKTRTGIRFEVWDTGIGIDDSKLKHIFNEFYKVNKVDVINDNEGLGLGLAIAKQLSMRVEQSDISVKSRLGRGSVFKFTVPLGRYEPI